MISQSGGRWRLLVRERLPLASDAPRLPGAVRRIGKKSRLPVAEQGYAATTELSEAGSPGRIRARLGGHRQPASGPDDSSRFLLSAIFRKRESVSRTG